MHQGCESRNIPVVFVPGFTHRRFVLPLPRRPRISGCVNPCRYQLLISTSPQRFEGRVPCLDEGTTSGQTWLNTARASLLRPDGAGSADSWHSSPLPAPCRCAHSCPRTPDQSSSRHHPRTHFPPHSESRLP